VLIIEKVEQLQIQYDNYLKEDNKRHWLSRRLQLYGQALGWSFIGCTVYDLSLCSKVLFSGLALSWFGDEKGEQKIKSNESEYNWEQDELYLKKRV